MEARQPQEAWAVLEKRSAGKAAAVVKKEGTRAREDLTWRTIAPESGDAAAA